MYIYLHVYGHLSAIHYLLYYYYYNPRSLDCANKIVFLISASKF